MRTFPGLLTVALTLSACTSYDPQTVTDNARGSAFAQIMGECQEQTLAPEFDMIRSRVNMSMTGANPAPFMLANMEVPTAAERIQIARWSAIRDSCSQRVVALISEPPAGISQGLWQKVVEPQRITGLLITEVPPEYRAPGTWMHDALRVRDDWESRLLRTSRWSPLY